MMGGWISGTRAAWSSGLEISSHSSSASAKARSTRSELQAVVERLSKTSQNELINIVTIFLGLSVGSKLSASAFLRPETLGILVLGAIAFSFGTAAGVLMAKLMNKLSENKVNPLIGAAGVSAVPMSARVANKVGQESNPHNFLLMHAMGPNVAGVIGSAVAAGVLLALVQ